MDGHQHAEPERAAYDERRAVHLESLGIRVIRFSNAEVLANLDDVLQTIWDALTLPSPAAAGEG